MIPSPEELALPELRIIHTAVPGVDDLYGLAPEGATRMWTRFAEISLIPRPSGSEGGVIDYLQEFAEARRAPLEQDPAGNLLMTFGSTPGFEDRPGTIFQAHMDMVCVGDDGRNPAIMGVIPIMDESRQWVRAEGTTLGADNGIGLAIGLALVDEQMERGPLRVLATVDEERGLKGVLKMSLGSTDVSGDKHLLNLDSEDDKEMIIGCAGGADSVIVLPVGYEEPGNKISLSVSLEGLMGGHSGVVIAEGRQNALKTLASVLKEAASKIDSLRLISIEGGDARNVIPKAAKAGLAVDAQDQVRLQEIIANLQQLMRDKTQIEGEKELTLNIGTDLPPQEHNLTLTKASSSKVLDLIEALPHGVERMSAELVGLPQTSTNLAVAKTSIDGVTIDMLTRSSLTSEREDLRRKITDAAEFFFANVTHEAGYPGWKPDPASRIVQLVQQEYASLNSGRQLKVGGTHGGLECGVILGNPMFAHMDAVSIGPTIEGAHTTGERVNIYSAERTYGLTKGIVERIATEPA